MTTLVMDPRVEKRLIAERQAADGARFDEMWEGVYVMPPMPNNEHQIMATRLGAVGQVVIDWPGLGVVAVQVNVSDREQDWEFNYRIPDFTVFLKGNKAKNCGTHWCGGPDFLSEILSPKDKARE